MPVQLEAGTIDHDLHVSSGSRMNPEVTEAITGGWDVDDHGTDVPLLVEVFRCLN